MLEAWSSKQIILYGESMNCHDFYMRYYELIQIKTIIYTDGIRASEQYLYDVPVRICDKSGYVFRISASNMIVVCAGDGRREEHDKYLYAKGLTFGQDYLDSWYIEFFFARKIKKYAENKSIWIFGAGNNGKNFYKKYKKRFHISGFISNYEKEKECLGLPVIRPYEMMGQKDSYVIISSDAAKEMTLQLREMGLREIENFCVQELLVKKLFIAWGACQVYSIAAVLYLNPSFQEEYRCISIFDSRFQECSHADRQRLYVYGNVCDVLFYNSEGMMERNRAFVEQYYQDAEIYNIPFYSFRGQLMQVTEDCSEYSLRYEGMDRHYAFWFIGDNEIEKMLHNGLGKEEILAEISSDAYWTVEEINRNWKSEIKKITVLDRLSSLKLSDYIRSHYREQIIFKDGIHFSKRLCIFLANQLAELMKLPALSNEWQEFFLQNCPEKELNCLPIYPCVKKVLGIYGVDEPYKFLHENGECEILDFREYESRYIDYLEAVISISQYCGTRII